MPETRSGALWTAINDPDQAMLSQAVSETLPAESQISPKKKRGRKGKAKELPINLKPHASKPPTNQTGSPIIVDSQADTEVSTQVINENEASMSAQAQQGSADPYTNRSDLTPEGAIQVLLDWDHDDDMTNRAMTEMVRLMVNTAWRSCNSHALQSVWLRKLLFDATMHLKATSGPTEVQQRHTQLLWDQVPEAFIQQQQIYNLSTYKMSVRAGFLGSLAYLVKESMPTPYIHGAAIPNGMRGWLDEELTKLGIATTQLLYSILPELKSQITYNYGATIPDVQKRLELMNISSYTGIDMMNEDDPTDPKIFRRPGTRR